MLVYFLGLEHARQGSPTFLCKQTRKAEDEGDLARV